MRIDWDIPIAMDDGLVLRADLFRPVAEGRTPVILTYGPYAKGLSFQAGYPSAWALLSTQHPDAVAGSSNQYQCSELVVSKAKLSPAPARPESARREAAPPRSPRALA
ncbi:MAG TPA: hypothetical protein VJN67_15690 [Stellaceae bacterium]|nr:hypothetical protein [Stellaceae bacterium]